LPEERLVMTRTGSIGSAAALRERVQIRLGRRVPVHVHVHGGRNGQGRARGEQHRREQVVGEPGRQLCQQVGGGGRDQDHLGPVGELDVGDLGLRAGREQLRSDRLTRQGLEHQRGDELERVLGRHHPDLVTLAPERPHQLRRLVGGDAARHAEEHPTHIRLAPRRRRPGMRFEGWRTVGAVMAKALILQGFRGTLAVAPTGVKPSCVPPEGVGGPARLCLSGLTGSP
jgi:hypothetical protein